MLFGAGCVVVIRYVQPLVLKAINAMPVKLGMSIVIIMSVLILLDTVASLMAVRKLQNKIKRLDELSKLMLSVSVKTGMKLASGTLKVKSNVDKIIDAKDNVVEKMTDVKDNVVEKMQDMNEYNLEKLRSEYERLISEKDTATERLLRAFPKFHSHNYSESLQLLRDKMLYKGHRHSSDETENQPEMIEESKEESKV